ncbi:MAG: hypothetical protein M0P31_10920 [Solirubrobacteraceae bacterium]|nr:hypothetical protein [Solirubrobacteraceae bacterium]
MSRRAHADVGVAQTDHPCWGPLEALLDPRLCAWFDWTYEARLDDGDHVQAYKHRTTRRYLHLARLGRAFRLEGAGAFVEVPLPVAIVTAFIGWQRDAPSPAEVAALRTALAAAGGPPDGAVEAVAPGSTAGRPGEGR